MQSRYYDPATGRFINADGYINGNGDLIGYNMYAYCSNNPVMNVDPTGEIAITTLIFITACVAGVLAASYTAYTEYQAGSSTEEIIFNSVVNGIGAFCTVYSLGTMAYQFYQQMCYWYGSVPVTHIGKSTYNASSALQNCADNVNVSITGKGPVVGTQKHTAFANQVNSLGNSTLRTEVSYLNGQEVPYGTKGSVRFDVVQYDSQGIPIHAWDFKTVRAVLTESRIRDMQFRSGLNIPIDMIK